MSKDILDTTIVSDNKTSTLKPKDWIKSIGQVKSVKSQNNVTLKLDSFEKIPNPKKMAILEKSNVIEKEDREKILVNILYLEAELKRFLFLVFKDGIRNILGMHFYSAKHWNTSSVNSDSCFLHCKDFENNAKMPWILKFFEDELRKSRKQNQDLNSKQLIEKLSFQRTYDILNLINIPVWIQNYKLKGPNYPKRTEDKGKIQRLVNVRNILAHPPINPRLTFEEFLSQSDIKQNNPSFKNKETILNTIEELNSLFFKLNEQIKKSQAKKSL